MKYKWFFCRETIRMVLLGLLFALVSVNLCSLQQEKDLKPDNSVEVCLECSHPEESPLQLILIGPGGRHVIDVDRGTDVQIFKGIKTGRYMLGIFLPHGYFESPSLDMVTVFNTVTGKFSSRRISAGKNEIVVKDHRKTFIHLQVLRKSGNTRLPIPEIPASIDVYLNEFRKIEANSVKILYRVRLDVLWRLPTKEPLR